MTPGMQIVFSGTLTFGVPLLLAVRELVVLRRGRGDDDGSRDARPRDPVPLPPGSEPEPRRLPDCLVPNLPVVSGDRCRVHDRKLEPV